MLALAEIAALVAESDAHLHQRVLRLTGTLSLGRAPGEALQRHVERLLLNATGRVWQTRTFPCAPAPLQTLGFARPGTLAALHPAAVIRPAAEAAPIARSSVKRALGPPS